MPARYPIFTNQGYYHVYNRGHNKQPIFLTYKDYQRYLKRLTEYLPRHPVTILAYCLMPNHIHLLLRQDTEESLEKFIHRLHTAYTMYFNKKYERVGSVFQGRFKAKAIETDEYLLHVSRYIHINPAELLHAQGPALSSQLLAYPWSSYEQYVSHSPKSLCNTHIVLDYFSAQLKKPKVPHAEYRRFVEEHLASLKKDQLAEISSGDL